MKPRRRGRPSKKEGPAITREDLLRLAARVIGREGLARASMRGIAKEAGVSLATLQNHFRRKELLWRAVVEELVVAREGPLASGSDLATVIRATVESRLGEMARSPGLAARVLVDEGSESAVGLEHLVDSTRGIRALNKRRLEQAIDEGRMRPVDVDALMVLLGVAVPILPSARSAIRQLMGPDLEDDDDRAALGRSIADILLYGLLPRRED